MRFRGIFGGMAMYLGGYYPVISVCFERMGDATPSAILGLTSSASGRDPPLISSIRQLHPMGQGWTPMGVMLSHRSTSPSHRAPGTHRPRTGPRPVSPKRPTRRSMTFLVFGVSQRERRSSQLPRIGATARFLVLTSIRTQAIQVRWTGSSDMRLWSGSARPSNAICDGLGQSTISSAKR